MLLTARDVGVKKVVSASSVAVYGFLPDLPKREEMPVDPLSPYAVEKHAGEEYSRIFSSLYGLSTVCLRYFNVYGLRQDPHSDYAAAVPRFIQRIRSGEPPLIYGDGNRRGILCMKDVVQANIRAMSPLNASGVYNIANGIGISVNDLAAMVLRVLGSEMQPVYAEGRSGEVKHSVADVSKARREFMFNPGYTLEKGLVEMLSSVISHQMTGGYRSSDF